MDYYMNDILKWVQCKRYVRLIQEYQSPIIGDHDDYHCTASILVIIWASSSVIMVYY